MGSGQWGKAAAMAVGNSMAGYVGNKIAGVQNTHFSWKSVAADTASSLITAGITNGLGFGDNQTIGGFGKFREDFGGGMIGGVVNLHARRAVGIDEKVDYGKIALDAFGNALGNAAVRGIQNYRAENAKAEWAADQAAHDKQMMLQDSAMGGLDSPGQYSTASGTFAADHVDRPIWMPDGGAMHADGSISYGVMRPMTEDEIDAELGVSPSTGLDYNVGSDSNLRYARFLEAPEGVTNSYAGASNFLSNAISKDSSIVMGALKAAQAEYEDASFVQQYRWLMASSTGKPLNLLAAEADARAFAAAPDTISRRKAEMFASRLQDFGAGKLDMSAEQAISLRSLMGTVNRYYMGDNPLDLGEQTRQERQYLQHKRLEVTNSLGIALLGPVFGAPGQLSRWAGMDEQQVAGAVEAGRLGMDMATAGLVFRPKPVPLRLVSSSGLTTTFDKAGMPVRWEYVVGPAGARGPAHRNVKVDAGLQRGHVKSVNEGASANVVDDGLANIIGQTRTVNLSNVKRFENWRVKHAQGAGVIVERTPEGYIRTRVPSKGIDVTYNPLSKNRFPANWFLRGGTYE
jgi:hypothetical protein